LKDEYRRAEDGIKVLVWTCNGLSSNKTEHKDFVSILLKNDICILSESWTDEHFDFT